MPAAAMPPVVTVPCRVPVEIPMTTAICVSAPDATPTVDILVLKPLAETVSV